MSEIRQLIQNVHASAAAIAMADTTIKNKALEAIANIVQQNKSALLQANEEDLEVGRKRGLSDALLDRLALNDERIAAMIEGLHSVLALPDPVGEISDKHKRPSGICVAKMRVPLGVIAIIYESRPNVTMDATALCLKAGNATVLRGGSEAIHSNRALAGYISTGLEQVGLPAHCVQLIPIYRPCRSHRAATVRRVH